MGRGDDDSNSNEVDKTRDLNSPRAFHLGVTRRVGGLDKRVLVIHDRDDLPPSPPSRPCSYAVKYSKYMLWFPRCSPNVVQPHTMICKHANH